MGPERVGHLIRITRPTHACPTSEPRFPVQASYRCGNEVLSCICSLTLDHSLGKITNTLATSHSRELALFSWARCWLAFIENVPVPSGHLRSPGPDISPVYTGAGTNRCPGGSFLCRGPHRDSVETHLGHTASLGLGRTAVTCGKGH